MKIYIQPETDFYFPTLYVLKTIAKNLSVEFEFVKSSADANLVWDDEADNSQPIAIDFWQNLRTKKSKLSHKQVFSDAPEIKKKEGKKDSIATIFYLINCLQELQPSSEELDEYGRFKYEKSYQARFNCIEDNLVQKEINTFCSEHGIKTKSKPSTFFVSHDIDTIYGSFLQDGFWAVKNLKIGTILSILANELIRKPHWKNMDRILKLNSEYDVRSTFFWLVNKGAGGDNIMNADYNLTSEKALLKQVSDAGFTNGLHKSSSKMTLDVELEKGEIHTTYNRYHFLNFNPHSDWSKISASKLTLDCSLGFAERYGFRNSYGHVFQPFDIEENKPFDFVEAPLNFMDGTFHKYMKMPRSQIGDTIINFYEKNQENCHFSLLWHNTYFTDYKYGGFLSEYKKVMAYIYENRIGHLVPQQLVEEGKLEW